MDLSKMGEIFDEVQKGKKERDKELIQIENSLEWYVENVMNKNPSQDQIEIFNNGKRKYRKVKTRNNRYDSIEKNIKKLIEEKIK